MCDIGTFDHPYGVRVHVIARSYFVFNYEGHISSNIQTWCHSQASAPLTPGLLISSLLVSSPSYHMLFVNGRVDSHPMFPRLAFIKSPHAPSMALFISLKVTITQN